MSSKSKPHLRYCKNKQCTLFEVPMEFAKGKSCGSCSLKTEYYGQIDYVGQNDDLGPAKDYIDRGNGQYALMEGEPESKSKAGSPIDFESDCDVKGCPLISAGPLVRVPFPLYQKWMFLAKKFPVEWIANLTGTTAEDGTITLDADGMYFPNQIATGATVKAEYLSQDKKENTIACVHSHVDMTAHFSTTDFDNFNSDVELVVNSRGSVDCMTRVKLKCGEFQRVQSKVDIIEAGDLTSCMKELKAKLSIKAEPKNSKSGLVILNSRDDNKAPNPTDQAVKMALKIIDRRIKHEGNVDLRALLDSQQS